MYEILMAHDMYFIVDKRTGDSVGKGYQRFAEVAIAHDQMERMVEDKQNISIGAYAGMLQRAV